MLDRREQHLARHRRLLRARSRRSTLQMRSKRGDGLMLEYAPDFEAVASLIEARRDLDAENGIAAEVEEVVMDPDPFDSQHLLPDLRQRPLRLIPRRFESRLQSRPLAVQFRQPLSVHF